VGLGFPLGLLLFCLPEGSAQPYWVKFGGGSAFQSSHLYRIVVSPSILGVNILMGRGEYGTKVVIRLPLGGRIWRRMGWLVVTCTWACLLTVAEDGGEQGEGRSSPACCLPGTELIPTTCNHFPELTRGPQTLHLFVIAPSPLTTPKIQHSFSSSSSASASPSSFSVPIPHRNLVCSLIHFPFSFFLFPFLSLSLLLLTPPQRRPLRRVHSLLVALLPLLCLSFSLCERQGVCVCVCVPLCGVRTSRASRQRKKKKSTKSKQTQILTDPLPPPTL